MVDALEHPSRGHVHSAAVAGAMRAVPREPFVPDPRTAYAHRDHEADGTRVFAPATAARLIEALEAGPNDSILIVGGGVGYLAAVLSEVADPRQVHAVEGSRRVVHTARGNLDRVGHEAVLVDRRDGGTGLPEYAPFDRILVAAAAVRPPGALGDQLAPHGRLVLPVGEPPTLTAFERRPEQNEDTAGNERPGAVIERAAEFGAIDVAPLTVRSAPNRQPRNRSRRELAELDARDARRRNGWEHDWIDWD